MAANGHAHVLEIYLLSRDWLLRCDLMRLHMVRLLPLRLWIREILPLQLRLSSLPEGGGDVVQREGRCTSLVAYHSFLAMIVMGCCCSRPNHCILGVSNQLTKRYT
jgi:hypothetical protein